MTKTIAGNLLKKFFSRTSLDEGRDRLHEIIRVRDEGDEEDEENEEEEGDEENGEDIEHEKD